MSPRELSALDSISSAEIRIIESLGQIDNMLKGIILKTQFIESPQIRDKITQAVKESNAKLIKLKDSIEELIEIELK